MNQEMTDRKIINVGDICLYFYDNNNKSVSIVEVVKYLSPYVLVVKFLQVFVDDSGNGLFDYFYRSKKTMNVSRKYLHKIDLINRQKAKIEALQMDNDQLQSDIINVSMNLEHQQEYIKYLKIENQSIRAAANSYKIHYNKAIAEGIREFAERLEARVIEDFLEYNTDTTVGYIDNLIKEMVGDKEKYD